MLKTGPGGVRWCLASRQADAKLEGSGTMKTRREFLTSLVAAGAMSLVAACGGAASGPAASGPTAAPKPAGTTAAGAPAGGAAATTAPAQAASKPAAAGGSHTFLLENTVIALGLTRSRPVAGRI